MLDFEKCKEVVEEVWKKKKVPQTDLEAMGFDSSDEYWDMITSGLDYFPCHFMDRKGIIQCVNSWEGFGRTVEAMEKLGYFLMGGYGGEIVFVDIKGRGRPSFALHCEENSEDFRDATHLAALEAVKDADKKNA